MVGLIHTCFLSTARRYKICPYYSTDPALKLLILLYIYIILLLLSVF